MTTANKNTRALALVLLPTNYICRCFLTVICSSIARNMIDIHHQCNDYSNIGLRNDIM